LYVRALLKGLRPAPPADAGLRKELEAHAKAEGTAALHEQLARLDPEAAQRLHPNDRVRIIRAIEIRLRANSADPDAVTAADWARSVPPWHLLMVGLRQEAAVLRARLAARVRDMVTRGMLEEVRRLLRAGYSESLPAMGGIGYRQFAAVLA